ncbi:ABC transporter permease [Fulvivirga sediminis]|uniref:ABC transporter permease n=1 Tax=Fulvivirga sediminis TaxID=2803949 RepID=A0A937JZU3_9BACT|nr:ABC transporter permease [Fulvivirga sediminis]MBL3656994.1 ABC transporter permease [Fulvivirga sediminis]
MNKMFLILQREFLSRVKKKSFLLTTILVPLLFPTIIGVVFYFIKKEDDTAKQKTVQVLDESHSLSMESLAKFKFVSVSGNLDHAKEAFKESDDFALLYIPDYDIEKPEGFRLYAKSNTHFSTINELEGKIRESVKERKLQAYKVDTEILEKLKTSIDLKSLNVSEGGEKENDAGISFIIGYATGFLIYIFMFAYGGQVMQGVIEEKSSKIVEVIVSTVKPFQLMMGKILGVAAVGLFQVIIWIVIVSTFSLIVSAIFGVDISQTSQMADAAQQASNSAETEKFMRLISSIPFTKIILTFIFYFLGGYLLYGSLFAAIGSAVDTPAEAQQFMMPIMMPLIVGIIGMSSVVNNPDGAVSFWLSIIPFTSPIIMMGRIGFGVPWWELALSMSLLIAGFIGTVWLSGRIYRVGILMHGVKVNYKTLAKWFMLKN